MKLKQRLNPNRVIEFFKENSFVKKAILRAKIPNKFPPFLWIEATNNCNLKCEFCPRERSGKKLGNISFELYKKIIDESVRHGKRLAIGLSKDGDPLMHPEIGRLVRYAKEKKAARFTHFTTNAVALHEKKALDVLKSGLDDLRISVDAASRETYKKIKGVDALPIVEENIKRFLELRKKLKLKKPFVRVKILRMKETKDEVKAFIKKWEDIADWVEVSDYYVWDDVKDFSIKKVPKRYACNYLWYWPNINWDGKVSICCMDNGKCVIGDVSKDSLYNIWNGEKLRKIRLMHLNKEYDKINVCKNCTGWAIEPNIEGWLRFVTR